MQALGFFKPIEWFFLGVSLYLTWRYAWLLDDAFVYFRYVDNWVLLERGLVFNPGEFVEGYTSPLWVLWLGVFRLTRIDYWSLIRVFSMLFAICFWLMCVVLRRRLTRSGSVINLPLAVFATHYGVQSYFSSGLETPLVQLMALVYALHALAPQSRWLAIVAGLAPLVRHDLALPWLVYVVGFTLSRRRPPLLLAASGVLATASWLLFRVYYYADFLPNTYYLKDETNFSQGWAYLTNTFSAQGLGCVLLVLAGLGGLLVARKHRSGESLPELEARARTLMLTAALISTAYVWRSGGDMLFYRFLAFPVILGMSAFHGVAERWLDRVRLPRRDLCYPLLGAFSAFVLVLGYPSQLMAHPATVRPVHGETMRKVEGISDASWHRHHPELRMSPERRLENQRLLERYEKHDSHGARPRIVTQGFCARAFTAFEARVVHSWGLTEPILARTSAQAERPGHKYGLLKLAEDLRQARQSGERLGELGRLAKASERGLAARWIDDNLDRIEVVERKMYNRHRFFENLELAMTRIEPIVVQPR